MPITLRTVSSTVAALILVLGLALVAVRGARIAGLFRGTASLARERRLGLQDTLALDRVRRVHIVRCDGRDLVLLTGGTADVVVGWLGDPGVVRGDAGP